MRVLASASSCRTNPDESSVFLRDRESRIAGSPCGSVAMEKTSRVLAVLLLAASLAACDGARDLPAEPEKPLRPQNVFGFGGFYPGPSVSWVFPGPNGVTRQVGFGGMPGTGAFPGSAGAGVTPFTPGGGGVVGIHAGGGAGGGAAEKP